MEGPNQLTAVFSELESLVNSGAKGPDALRTFDLLTKLLSCLKSQDKESIVKVQRQCEDKLEALLLLGLQPPNRRLASQAMVQLISKGESISIYSRANGIQGWLSDFVDKKKDPAAYIGAAQCLGVLMRIFGQKLTSSLQEIASIVGKLMKHQEVSVRYAALQLLQDAMEGTAGGGSAAAHTEAVRVATRMGAGDKAPAVRAAAAGCLRAIARAGGPGLHGSGLESAATGCVKGLEDPSQGVRDGYAAALGALVALGLNPQAQIQPKTKGALVSAKPLEGAVQRFLVAPFVKAGRQTRMGLALAWVAFLQSMHSSYGLLDTDLISYATQAMEMLKPTGGKGSGVSEPQALACVIYIVRVGVVEQMGEVAQRELTTHLIKQLPASEAFAPVLVVMLRTLAHLLDVLGEVSLSTREALDATLTAILNNPSVAVRVETARTIRALALVDPGCVNGMMYCGVTLMRALRESVAGARGDHLRADLDSLHGQAAMLAALLVAAPRLPLGVPSRLADSIFEVAQEMVLQPVRNPIATNGEREVGWLLIAALIASMSKDELEEHAIGLLALWAIPFGGNSAERVKKVEPGLQSEIATWVAAMDALGAFIRHCITPLVIRNAPNSATLLQPVLGYLSGALQYLSSPVLQDSAALKAGMEQLTIRTLDAYRTLPEANLYKIDHVPLLAICTLPFRDASNTSASSCLRHLLNSADACLGPWMPGRDSFEDELRAFQGGSDGLLPCVWASGTPAFPQPLPQAVSVVDSMLLCFGAVFGTQSESKKNALLDMVLTSLKAGRKQPWRGANAANIGVALLVGLKAASGRGKETAEPEMWKKAESVIQGVLQADPASPVLKRGAGEALGLLAKLADDAFRVRLTRSLISEIGAAGEGLHKAGMAFALGCIHRIVGGMALQTLVSGTVQALTSLAKDSTDGLHIWALHGLWLTSDAAGLAFFPHVQATLSTCMDLLMSEDHSTPELQPAVGRLVNATVAVLGPELSSGSAVFSRCQSIVADMSTAEEPSAQLECVLYAQQLVLFAPQAVPSHNIVETLRATLSSRQPSLRHAAIATLRHLSERDPSSIIPERIEEDLFAMLDSETDAKIMSGVRSTLERLLEAACPTCPSRWLGLCKNVVLAASTTKSAGTQPSSPTAGAASPKAADDGGLGENDEEGFGVSGGPAAAGPAAAKEGPKAGTGDLDRLPRYRTRVFAAECLERLPGAVGAEKAHFDLEKAEEEKRRAEERGLVGTDWLVLHLSELVGIAFQMVTGPLEMLRPMGVTLLNIVLEKFGVTEDPHFEGHLLLEQYQAQLVSALRAAFEPGVGPLLMSAGAKLAAGVITTGVAAGDRGVLQRVLTMLCTPLSKWDALTLPSYAEWVGSTVKVSLLEAHARVKCFACRDDVSKSGADVSEDVSNGASTPGTPVAEVLQPLMRPHGPILARCWVGLLRDYTAGRLLTSSFQGKYQPFLQDSHSAAAMAAVRPYLEGAWVKVFEAVTIGVTPGTVAATPVNGRNGFQAGAWGTVIDSREFDQLWGIALAILSEGALLVGGEAAGGAAGQPVELRRVALQGLKRLCAPAFCVHNMLSTDLCRELLQAVSSLAAQEKNALQQPILELLEQLTSSTPEDYLTVDSLLRDSVAELGLSELRLILSGSSGAGPVNEVEVASLQAAFRALGALASRAGPEGQTGLIPQLLAEGLRALESVSVVGGALAATGEFVTALVNALGGEKRVQIVGGIVESLAEIADKETTALSENAGAENKPSTSLFETGGLTTSASAADAEARLPLVLIVLGNATKPVIGETSGLGKQAVLRSIDVLRTCLNSPSTIAQSLALQALRNALQTAVAEKKNSSPNDPWARALARELTPDVCAIVHRARSSVADAAAPMTSASANVFGDCLKVLVLLHSAAEGAPAQEEVLTVLIATVIAATAAPLDGHNAASSGLVTLAVKLVTHLATVPATAAQFKKVVASLPPETKQQLQAVLRASAGGQPVTAPAEPRGVVAAPPKLVIPLKAFAPPPSAGAAIHVAVPQKASKATTREEDLDGDWGEGDEWGEAKVATSSETAATSAEAPVAASHVANGGAPAAAAEDDFDEDDWGDEFESAPPVATSSQAPEADVSAEEPTNADVSVEEPLVADKEPTVADVSPGKAEAADVSAEEPAIADKEPTVADVSTERAEVADVSGEEPVVADVSAGEPVLADLSAENESEGETAREPGVVPGALAAADVSELEESVAKKDMGDLAELAGERSVDSKAPAAEPVDVGSGGKAESREADRDASPSAEPVGFGTAALNEVKPIKFEGDHAARGLLAEGLGSTGMSEEKSDGAVVDGASSTAETGLEAGSGSRRSSDNGAIGSHAPVVGHPVGEVSAEEPGKSEEASLEKPNVEGLREEKQAGGEIHDGGFAAHVGNRGARKSDGGAEKSAVTDSLSAGTTQPVVEIPLNEEAESAEAPTRHTPTDGKAGKSSPRTMSSAADVSTGDAAGAAHVKEHANEALAQSIIDKIASAAKEDLKGEPNGHLEHVGTPVDGLDGEKDVGLATGQLENDELGSKAEELLLE